MTVQTVSPELITKLVARVESLEKETTMLRRLIERVVLLDDVNRLIAEWEASDEDNPRDSLRIAALEGKLGLSIPVGELWDGIDAE